MLLEVLLLVIFRSFVSNSMNKGFTLIEALVVIAIIGIVASVSIGVLKLLQPSLKLKSATRDLMVDLRYAQQMAVTEQVNYGVHFSTTTNSYQFFRYGTTTQELSEKSLSEGIAFQEIVGFSSNEEAIFNPYGATVATGTVSLINTENETKIIGVRPSGFVKLLE